MSHASAFHRTYLLGSVCCYAMYVTFPHPRPSPAPAPSHFLFPHLHNLEGPTAFRRYHLGHCTACSGRCATLTDSRSTSTSEPVLSLILGCECSRASEGLRPRPATTTGVSNFAYSGYGGAILDTILSVVLHAIIVVGGLTAPLMAQKIRLNELRASIVLAAGHSVARPNESGPVTLLTCVAACWGLQTSATRLPTAFVYVVGRIGGGGRE